MSISQELLEKYARDDGPVDIGIDSADSLLRRMAKEIIVLRKQVSELWYQAISLQEALDNLWKETAGA